MACSKSSLLNNFFEFKCSNLFPYFKPTNLPSTPTFEGIKMKKVFCALFVFLFVNSAYALPAGTYSRQIKNWGIGTSGNATGIGFALVTVEDPGNNAIVFDASLQDTIEKQKILAAMLASIKAMGG